MRCGPTDDCTAEWLRKMVSEQRRVEEYFYGDFYPLLAFSMNDEVWAMWQYDRPDLGEGLVMALRRQESPFAQAQACLQGLEPGAIYVVESIDGGDSATQIVTAQSA